MKKIAIFSLFLMLCSSCLYTNIQMPMDKNFDQTRLGEKQGESSSHMVLYLVSWGDGGTREAAKQGDLEVINHADRKVFSFLFGLYTKISTVAYGE